MALPDNVLRQVQTWQDAGLQALRNYSPGISTTNKKFLNFQNMAAQLGTSVTYQKPYRFTSVNNLVWQPQGTNQRFETLTVDQQISTSVAFNVQQFEYNVDQYMGDIGRDAIVEIGTRIERNVLNNFISGVANNDDYTVPNPSYGIKNTRSGPYRFYGDGTTQITSYQQLAEMISKFDAFGTPPGSKRVFLPNTAVPAIVGSGLSQFVINRNEENYRTWMVMDWNGVNYYQSTILPIQYAGNVGNEGTTLTLVSVNDPTGANVTQLTFSGASASDADAIKSGDLASFDFGVSGKPDLHFLTFTGHFPTSLPVQFMATADAASDGSGNVTVDIKPALVWQSNNSNQNIDHALQPGMQVTFLPDHKAGIVIAGDAFYLAMPRLPVQEPFPTANKSDEMSGVSFRQTYGTILGQNQSLMGFDAIFGSFLDPDYCMRICFPLTQ